MYSITLCLFFSVMFWRTIKLYYESDNYNICPSVVSIVSPEIQTLGNTTTSWIIESVVWGKIVTTQSK